MRHSTLIRATVALAAIACGTATSEGLRTADILTAGPTITTDKTAYTRADLEVSGAGVRATLVGSPTRPYYARLGDAFNGAVDQNPLYAAEGSDGMLERQVGGSWVKVSGAILVEGVREVIISPSKSYSLIANASPPVEVGTYRVSITLRETSGGNPSGKIVSPPFDVR